MAANPIKVRLPGSGYSTQLRGVTGTRTAGITLNGSYDSNWDMYVFDVLISGLYELWFDPAGGASYSKDSVWSGTGGKLLLGEDFALSLEP